METELTEYEVKERMRFWANIDHELFLADKIIHELEANLDQIHYWCEEELFNKSIGAGLPFSEKDTKRIMDTFDSLKKLMAAAREIGEEVQTLSSTWEEQV